MFVDTLFVTHGQTTRLGIWGILILLSVVFFVYVVLIVLFMVCFVRLVKVFAPHKRRVE